ncbi:hypothetical protein ABEB36_007092 [Hypothenemus hampei]|uniref:Uncharacterized protein n=1 Tax=Hypothenemus hampei TaxID=57062 RepID=A0ABD1EST5_HYPHA
MSGIKPNASSTPNRVPKLQARKRVGAQDSIESPIESSKLDNENWIYSNNRSPPASPSQLKIPRNVNIDEDSECNSDSNDSTDAIEPHKSTKTDNKLNIWILISVPVVLLFAGFTLHFTKEATEPKLKLILSEEFSNLEKKFPQQHEDFFLSIRIAIEEILKYQQPRTLLLIYDSPSEVNFDQILGNVSETAVCFLRNCSIHPTVVSGFTLGSPEFVKDYGRIIDHFKDKLSNSGILIVENLEKVPGKSAQAFHYLCDEYNPSVPKALIILTMKVDQLPKMEFGREKFVRDILRGLWNDIGLDDKFDPLMSRISGNILIVNS